MPNLARAAKEVRGLVAKLCMGEVVLKTFPHYRDAERLLEHGISTVVKVTEGGGKVAFEARNGWCDMLPV